MTSNVAGIVRRQADAQPGRTALHYTGREITYHDLDQRSNRIAQGLRAAGVGPEDRIAFIDRNGPEYLEVVFGAAKLNAVNVAINWRLRPGEMASLVNDARARVLFVGQEFFGQLDQVAAELQTITKVIALADHPRHESYERWLAAFSADDPGLDPAPDDVALQLYTSGTTGLPKGAMITNSNLECLFTRIADVWELDARSVNLVASPMFNIAGGGWALLGMHHGGETVLLREVTAATLLDAIPRYRVTNALLAPVFLQMMLATPGCETVDFSSLRAIVYGASPISEELLARSLKAFGCHFVQAYALTEHTGVVTSLLPEEHDLSNPERLRSAGRPHSWIEMRIADPATGAEVPLGQVGEVWARSPQVMKGYWMRPEETAATITEDGWLRTGDAGYVDAGGYLYLYDRVKDMIISGGQNVYPVEVENVLAGHPSVADVAVIGVPDDRWGETVKALVVRAPGTDPEAGEILEHARARLAHFKCPTSVDFVETLPRNPSGKVLKRELREPYWRGRARLIG